MSKIELWTLFMQITELWYLCLYQNQLFMQNVFCAISGSDTEFPLSLHRGSCASYLKWEMLELKHTRKSQSVSLKLFPKSHIYDYLLWFLSGKATLHVLRCIVTFPHIRIVAMKLVSLSKLCWYFAKKLKQNVLRLIFFKPLQKCVTLKCGVFIKYING